MTQMIFFVKTMQQSSMMLLNQVVPFRRELVELNSLKTALMGS